MNRSAVCLLGCLVMSTASPAVAQDVKAITGATVIGGPGNAPIADAVVIIDGGRIRQVGPRASTPVPANAVVIDAGGKFVIPGLADMHNHVRSGSFRLQQNLNINLLVLLAHGVTTILNPSSSKEEFAALKAAAATDSARAPRFFGTGPSVTTKDDGLGVATGGRTPVNPAEAEAAVKDLKSAGVDAIKLIRDDGSWSMTQRMSLMSGDVLTAVVSEAHRQQLKVYVHAPLLVQAKEALRAGVDGLLHGIIDEAVDQEFLGLMKRNQAVYVPTLSLYEDVADVGAWARRQVSHNERSPLVPIISSFTTPAGTRQFESMLDNTSFTKSHLATQRANLKRVFDAGVPVVMGTDAGFFGVLMGVSSQIELELMVEAGLTPEAALRAATINAARMIGRDKESGSVEAGKLADVLILDANPLEDVRNIRRIHRVIRGGVVHDPAQLLSEVRVGPPGAPNR